MAGDPEVEAKGRVEQDASVPGDPTPNISEADVEGETEAVRRKHHDID